MIAGTLLISHLAIADPTMTAAKIVTEVNTQTLVVVQTNTSDKVALLALKREAAATGKIENTPKQISAVNILQQTDAVSFEQNSNGQVGDVPPEIIVTGRTNTPKDPLQSVNAASYDLVQKADDAVIAPVSKAYEKSLPKPVRNGVRNLLNNIKEPVVFVNYLLQIKIGKAAETAGRFAINSTIGVAGLFDMAKRKPINLPLRPNGFADTLGYYGVKPGAYLYLPLIGPTTVRDLVGQGVDSLVIPFAFGRQFAKSAFTIPTNVVGAIDRRGAFDEQLQKIRASDDPYVAEREYYLKHRQDEIDALHVRKTKTVKSETIGD